MRKNKNSIMEQKKAMDGPTFKAKLMKGDENTMNENEIKENAKSGRIAHVLYKASWNWKVAEKNYRNQYNKKNEELNDDDKAIIWKYCNSELAFMIAWLIEKDLIIPANEIEYSTVNLIRERKETPDAFISIINEELCDHNLKKKIILFVCNYFKGDIREKDYYKFAMEKLNRTINNYEDLYSFAFEWEDYDNFKKYINKAYRKFNVNMFFSGIRNIDWGEVIVDGIIAGIGHGRLSQQRRFFRRRRLFRRRRKHEEFLEGMWIDIRIIISKIFGKELIWDYLIS